MLGRFVAELSRRRVLRGGAIYIGEGTLNGSAWHDFAVKDMTGHEYVHHLQAISGMFEAEYRLNQGNEGIRRSELQATCGGFAMIANDDSFTMTPEIYETFEPFLRAVIEDGIHGSKDSVAYWGLRGLHSSLLLRPQDSSSSFKYLEHNLCLLVILCIP